MIHENEPPDEGSLKVQAWLELSMTQTHHHLHHNVTRDPSCRVKIPHENVEAALVQMAWDSDQVDEVIEAVGQQASLIDGRGKIGNSRLYVD